MPDFLADDFAFIAQRTKEIRAETDLRVKGASESTASQTVADDVDTDDCYMYFG